MTDERDKRRAPTPIPGLPRDNRDFQRPKTNPVSLAVPHEVAEDFTDQYEGEELQALRRKRPHSIRLDKLEVKVDALVETRIEHGEAIARVETKLEALPRIEEALKEANQRHAEREQLMYKQTTEIGTAEQLAKIEEQKHEKLAEVDVDAHAVKTRRERWTTVWSASWKLVAGGGAIEILHRLGVL